MTIKSAVEKLEDGKKQLHLLIERRTRIQVQLESAKTQLKEAQVEAELDYGTANLADLRELYKQREEQNNAAVDAFIQSLTELELTLKQTETALNS